MVDVSLNLALLSSKVLVLTLACSSGISSYIMICSYALLGVHVVFAVGKLCDILL